MSRLRIACVFAPVMFWGVWSSPALGQDLIINRFDGAGEVGGWDQWWGTSREISWDSAKDADGNAASGAMKVVAHYTTPGTWTSAVAIKWFGLGDVTNYGNLEMDVFVDSASAGTAGNHGLLQWYFARDDASLKKNTTTMNLGAGGADGAWYHLSVPISGFPGYGDNPSAVNQFTFIGFESGNDTLSGDVTFWMDNIKLTPKEPLPPPPTEPLVLGYFINPADADDWAANEFGAKLGEKMVDNGELKIVINYSGTTDCDNCSDPNEHVPTCTSAPEEPNDGGCDNMIFLYTMPAPMDLRSHGSFEVDVRYDMGAQNAATGGYLEFGPRSGPGMAWTHAGGVNITGAGTVHLSIPVSVFGLANLKDVRGWGFQLWGHDPQYDGGNPRLDGPVTLHIDNMLVVPPPTPPNAFYTFNEFNSADEVTQWCPNAENCNVVAGNTPAAHVTWDPTQDATGDPASGSMKVEMTWLDESAGNTNDVQFQRYLPGNSGILGLDLRDYIWVIARVKFDPNSAKAPWGDTAGGGVVFRNSGYTWDGAAYWVNMHATGGSVDERGWFMLDTYFKAPTTPKRDQLIGLTLQFAATGWGVTGPATFWIDHIQVGRVQPCADPNHCEICNNIDDNNGNGLADCLDTDCPGTFACPMEDVCDDHEDNDGDSLTDCVDPDCNLNPHCKSNDPFADLDNDGDVDQYDFAVLQTCMTGSVDLIASGCGMLDRDNDGDIDNLDVGKFVACAGASNIPANPACDNPE